MDHDRRDSVWRQLTDAFGNRKYFLISAAVTFVLMLAALVTASRHLNNVRNQAVDPRRRVPFRLKQLSSQSTPEGLVNDLSHFMLGPKAKDGNKSTDPPASCRHPDCHWVSLYLRNREQNALDPCEDMYGHVCSHRWSGDEYPFGTRSYRDLTVGATVANLHRYFNATSKKAHPDKKKERFLHQVSNLYLDCTIDYKGKNEHHTLLDLMRDFHVQDVGHDENLTSLLGALDRELRVFPFVRVSLTPDLRRVQVSPADTLLKRYYLSSEDPRVEDYVRIVARTLALLKPDTDGRKHAQNVHDFERKLENAFAGLVRAQRQQTVPVQVQNKRDEFHSFWKWDEYFTALMKDRKDFDMSQLTVRPTDLLQRMSHVIGETDSRTLLDYVRFRFVAFVAPFLSEDFRFLLPLGHPYYQEQVPVRSLACLHSIESVFPYAMWFFASSANRDSVEATLWKEQQNIIGALATACKRVIKNHLSHLNWMTPAELESTLARTENASIVTEHDFQAAFNNIIQYYSRMAVPLASHSPLQAFIILQQSSSELYWASKNGSLDLDARRSVSSLVPGYEYGEFDNAVWITPATLGLLSAANVAPIFLIPSVLPHIIMGLLAPIYVASAKPGYVRYHETSTRITKARLCLFEQYYAGMTDLLRENVALDSGLTRFVELDTLVSILYDVFQIYKNVTTSMTVGVSGGEENSTDAELDQLLVTAWTLSQCEQTTPAAREQTALMSSAAADERMIAVANARERAMIRFMEVPPRLKVDISLQNFEKFADIFNCPVGSNMNPPLRCRML